MRPGVRSAPPAPSVGALRGARRPTTGRGEWRELSAICAQSLWQALGGRPRSPAAGRSLLALVLMVAVAASGTGRALAQAGPAGTVTETELATAIARALDWIEAHPATLQDGGFIDIVDEAVAFLVLYNFSRRPDDRSRFAATLRDRLSALEQLPAFEAWVYAQPKSLMDHYHLVLTAHLMQLADRPSAFQASIVAQAQRALLATPQASPTVRLTVVAFLEYLDGVPPGRVNALLADSVVAQVARAGFPALPARAAEDPKQITTLLLSALVHEVIALTDFGRLPPSPWLSERRAALLPSLVDAVHWASTERNIDLACELVMTAGFLGEPLRAELRGLAQALVASQQPDGTWGASPTTPRQNKQRHTVLTATAILWAYANQRDD